VKSFVDIIIPTKNCGSHLEKCLRSLKRQTVPVRVIVVDGGSTDNTVQIAYKYDCVVLHEPRDLPEVVNNRCAYARNLALKYARSCVVGFLDADVEVPSCWVEDLLKFLGGRVVGVTSGCMPPHYSSGISYLINRVLQYGSTHAKRFTHVEEVESVPTYNALYLRQALMEVGGFDSSLQGCEDWELNLRIRKKGFRLLGVPCSPVKHRHHITLREFIEEMFGYGWSRGHLLIKKQIFTFKHLLPSLIVLGLPFLFVLPWWLSIRIVFTYLWILFMLGVKSLGVHSTPKNLTQTIGIFILFHVSYGVGYLKGVLDTLKLSWKTKKHK